MQIGSIADRVITIDRKTVDAKERKIPLSFSSDAPVLREGFYEILDHSPGAADFNRAPFSLVVEHKGDDLVGVVEDVQISRGKGRGVARLGKGARASEVWQDVEAGIRRNTSLRYVVHDVKPEGRKNGLPVFRVTKWEAVHVSFVSDPADSSVGVHRSITTMKTLDHNPADGGGGASDRAVEIMAVADRIGTPTAQKAAREFLADRNRSAADFKAYILETEYRARPVSTPPEIGMGSRDLKAYSLCRAILEIGTTGRLTGLEREASDAVAKIHGKQPTGFWMPYDIQLEERTYMRNAHTRALTSNVFSAGGALVGTDLQTGNLIELLRNQMYVTELGAMHLTGLVGDVAIPKQTGGATTYWLAQGATGTRTQQAFGQVGMTPKRLFAATAYDRQLVAQSSLDIESFVRSDIMQVIAVERDRAAINGSGASGEPLGILNQESGTLSTPVTFATAAAPLFTECIKFETNLATNNADRGNLGYLVHPTVRGHLKGYPKFASTGTPIWENDIVNGYPARATNQVPVATSTIFGKWSDLVLGDWATDIVVDPFSLSLTGQISVVLQVLCDNAIRNRKSFAVSTN